MPTQKQYKYTLPIGYRLQGGENDYVIEEVLGKGGFGVTYKVKARVQYRKIYIDAYFAVKEYFPDICSREADNATIKIPETKQDEIVDGIKDFLNEGRKLQQVCDLNPNIVNVNEVFEANGTAYYVLEYLEGGDLRKMVKNNGGKGLTEQQMLDVMVPIGRAVQCLHDNNILHLDIKPDNIVMRRNNNGEVEPVLIDFGIAVHFASDGTPTSKTPSQGISPGYSPIEQYKVVKTFDPRIDVYAYCATCLYLLTGKDPIEAFDLSSDFFRNEIPANISSNVARAIECGMSINKNSRTATINQVLAEFADNDVIEALPPEKLRTPSKPDNTLNLHSLKDDSKPSDKSAAKPALIGGSSKQSKGKSKKNIIAVVIVLAIALIAGIVLLSKRCSTSDSSDIESSIVEGGSSEDNIIGDDDVETIKVTDDVSITMVKVPGGTFTMGATSEQGSDVHDNEKPAHSVTLSTYYIGQTEVTQELWEAVMGENPSYFNGYGNSKYGNDHNGNYGTNLKRPVESVSWDDCQTFINKLNAKTGKNFRLPTEAEWEYAARGGNKSKGYKYSGSNTSDDVAWFRDIRSDNETHDVATKQPNELGIYDMSGNVLEWCSDNWYNYDGISTPYGSYRVLRGGSWGNGAESCRTSSRTGDAPDCRDFNQGLRLAL